MDYEIICTFTNREQLVLYIFSNENTNESEFIKKIFKKLYINEVKQLVKLSCCQIHFGRHSKLLKFIEKNNGKYYFNTDDNDFSHTKYWNNFRNEYIKTNIKRRYNILISTTLIIGALLFLKKRNLNSNHNSKYKKNTNKCDITTTNVSDITTTNVSDITTTNVKFHSKRPYSPYSYYSQFDIIF